MEEKRKRVKEKGIVRKVKRMGGRKDGREMEGRMKVKAEKEE